MIKRKISDVVLVFDSYYRNKPNSVALILKRCLLCCGLNLCALMYAVQLFEFSVNMYFVAACSVLISAFFSLLFVFVKKRFAILGLTLLVAFVIWRIGKPFWDKMSMFWDKILLVMDGRFFPARLFLFNNISYIDDGYLAYRSAELLGVIFLISIFSMITAACLFNKIHPTPMILTWLILWIPVIVGEKLYFNLWFVPAAALYAAVVAMSISYSQSLAVGRGTTSYCGVVKVNESAFIRKTAKQPYTTKILNRHEYYSRYYSLAVYLFAVFALLGVGSSILLRNSSGLDYSKLFDLFNSIGTNVPDSKPFDHGSLSEYFTKMPDSANFSSSTLEISSPGISNQEILRVTNSGTLPVYLRGDIGISFKGGAWTSPVNTRLDESWSESGLESHFRPAELNAVSDVLQAYWDVNASQYGDLYENSVQSQVVTVDYLCDTNVAFLSAYATDFGYYENEMFDIYGDFVARANKDYKTVNSLQFSALVPTYNDYLDNPGLNSMGLVSKLNDFNINNPRQFSSEMNYICGYSEICSLYDEYVNITYLDVPEELVQPLSEFIVSNCLLFFDGDLSNEYVKYGTAALISNFLRENYTYSLFANVDSNDPIMSFLNDTKSGHCALYASSMTLMLRTLGIPARYCTGFVAQPGYGEPQILRSKNLHAWCEVYLGRLGWVTFDPTSAAFGDFEFSLPESFEMPSMPDISLDISLNVEFSSGQSDENSGDSSERFSDSDENSDNIIVPGGSDNVNFIPYILGISGIFIVIGVVVLAIYRYKNLERDAQLALKRLTKCNDTDLLLRKIHDVMRICGFSPGRGEMPDKFYMRADEGLGCGIYSNHEVLEAAAFGSDERSDCKALAKLLEKLYNYAEHEFNFIKRTHLRMNFVKKY